jgi:hypothetical protein
LVQLAMMTATERHGELITHLDPMARGLRKAQMVRIGWAPTADKTGL